MRAAATGPEALPACAAANAADTSVASRQLQQML
jgi:hypothetical protein